MCWVGCWQAGDVDLGHMKEGFDKKVGDPSSWGFEGKPVSREEQVRNSPKATGRSNSPSDFCCHTSARKCNSPPVNCCLLNKRNPYPNIHIIASPLTVAALCSCVACGRWQTSASGERPKARELGNASGPLAATRPVVRFGHHHIKAQTSLNMLSSCVKGTNPMAQWA